MRLGIDASNIRGGGGITYLTELMHAAKPQEHGVNEVILWGGAATLGCLNDRPWLRKVHEPLLDRRLPFRQYWQHFQLSGLAREAGCHLLFAPGSMHTGNFRPLVTISRNMLPFEWKEAGRYGMSWQLLRIALLRRFQTQTFRKADGLIFLTEYARNGVMDIVRPIHGTSVIIPHGVDARFLRPIHAQRAIGQYSPRNPFRILYVSAIDVYKHQEHVAEAVSQLSRSGMPVRLDLVGPPLSRTALRRLREVLGRMKAGDNPVQYHGPVAREDLPAWYQQANLFVFGSTCENMPNTLLEAMASALPIACSNRGPMPEILGNGAVYFDPEQPQEISKAIRLLIDSPSLREEKARLAQRYVQAFSWQRCAAETFQFFARVRQLQDLAHEPAQGNHEGVVQGFSVDQLTSKEAGERAN